MKDLKLVSRASLEDFLRSNNINKSKKARSLFMGPFDLGIHFYVSVGIIVRLGR